MRRTVTIECRYPVSAEQVYAAFADAKNLTAWFAEHARVDLSGGVFEFWGQAHTRRSGHHA